MAKFREPLPPSCCIHLKNDLIRQSPIQQKFIDFKTKMKIPTTQTLIDTVGPGHWSLFRNRHVHVLVEKKGQKIEMDRDSWCTKD